MPGEKRREYCPYQNLFDVPRGAILHLRGSSAIRVRGSSADSEIRQAGPIFHVGDNHRRLKRTARYKGEAREYAVDRLSERVAENRCCLGRFTYSADEIVQEFVDRRAQLFR